MTAYSQTVSNSVGLFGCPADNWNDPASLWGTFKWGQGTTDLPTKTRHLVTNTLTPTEDSVGHDVRHLVTNTLTPTEDSIGHAVWHLVTNTLTPTEDSIGHAIQHLVTNTLTPTEDCIGHVVRKLIANTLDITDTEAENFIKTIQNALAMSEDTSALYLQDPANYFYVFPEDTANAKTQGTPTWTSVTDQSSTWTTATAASTTWSDA